MVTFEDFFAKKKIDLQALKKAEPELYTEFQIHYHAMGEKSFDHTKKFWFNRLRKSYRLHEEDVPVQKVDTALVEDTSAKEATVNKKLGFKPKFKTVAPKSEEIDASEVTSNEAAAAAEQEHKPTGFKPRFKAGVTKTEEDVNASAEVANKPSGFKPRFKAGVTKSIDAETSEVVTNDEPTVSEPNSKPTGFKPRFKAGVTKTEEKKEEVSEDVSSSAEVASKPTGFKPRFKVGITKTQPPESENDN